VTSNLNYKLFGKDIDQWFAFISNIGACLSLCDHVITTNSYIAQRLAEFVDLPVSVIPNFLNEEQLTVSAPLWEDRRRSQGPGLSIGTSAEATLMQKTSPSPNRESLISCDRLPLRR